jgi:hypothetical protein
MASMVHRCPISRSTGGMLGTGSHHLTRRGQCRHRLHRIGQQEQQQQLSSKKLHAVSISQFGLSFQLYLLVRAPFRYPPRKGHWRLEPHALQRPLPGRQLALGVFSANLIASPMPVASGC